ncbi:MAG: flagellar hook-associated protein 3, partial [Desulfobulbus sp.]|nr:flagellar hook-associated protein 3 [Desulfobulbus sp.]
YQEDTVPFTENPAYDPLLFNENDSSTWPYLYRGDAHGTTLEITPGETIPINLTGSSLFFGTSSWDPDDPTQNTTAPGRYNLFLSLTRAEEAIRAGSGDDMEASLTDLEGAAQQNRLLRAQLGNRAARVETAMTHQADVRVDLQQILSRYEDADVFETFTAIMQQETALQAALSITGRVSQLSILNYL